MKYVDVITAIEISAPREKVAEYAADPDNATKWYKNITSIKWITPKPLRIGSEVAFTAQFLGNKLEYTYKMIEFIPGKKLVMRTADGPFPMETTYIWEQIKENTTRMTLQNRGNPSGFSSVFSPFMKFFMRKANEKDLKQLKKILENQVSSLA